MEDDFPHFDLGVLTDRQREVVEMRYCHCLTFGQIAMLTGSNYHAIAEMHRRALVALRGSLRVDSADYEVDA